MRIETKTIQLSQSICFDLFLENSKGRIYAIMSSIFFLSNKDYYLANKRTIVYCLLRKTNIAKNEHTFS